MSDLSDLLYIWSGPSTFHGLSRIFRIPNPIQKLLWFACILLSFIACTFFVASIIRQFSNYDVTTTVEQIQENKLIFPAVTICNKNLIVNNESLEFMNYLLKKNETIKISKILNALYNLYLLPPDERAKKSLSLDEIILKCVYFTLQCDKEKFEIHYIGNYGTCFSFNNNVSNRLSTSIPGITNGISFEIFVGFNNKYMESKGSHIFIHEPGVYPTYNQGYDLEVRTSTNFAIEKKIEKKLPKPYNNCTDNKELSNSNNQYYKVFLDYNISYTQESCLNLCLQHFQISKCSCFDSTGPPGKLFFIPGYPNVRPCSTANEISCSIDFFLKHSKYSTGECLEKCWPSCDQITYNFAISKSNYPTPEYLNQMMENRDFIYENKKLEYKELDENILQINIYFEAIAYESIKQAPVYEIIDLISDIGGTFGFFLGASFLSFIEFIELFLNIFIIFFVQS
jgi:hypothetical protein